MNVSPSGNTRPFNILVILADQLRRDALGCYGDPNVKTPHIDALAARGVRFDNACTNCPVCVPARFTLMTGQSPHTRMIPAIEWRMSPAERTLADEFNDAGHETIYIGKWHLYGSFNHLPDHTGKKAHDRPVPPMHQGRWKKWLGFELRNSHFDTAYYEDDNTQPTPLGEYQTDGLFKLALDRFSARHEDAPPFMCVLSVEPPHFPYEAPQAFEMRWIDRPIKTPENFMVEPEGLMPAGYRRTSAEEALRLRRLYYAMVENFDHNIGRMTDFLARTGLDENTVVVVLSDHGEMGGAHGIDPPTKLYPYEESVGIPLIVAGPRVAGRGRVIEDAVAMEDVLPTLLGLVGRVPRDPMPGVDLTPLIDGRQASLNRDGVYLQLSHDMRPGGLFSQEFWRGLRTRRYKYTLLGTADGARPWQCFDLQEDPGELHNLIGAPASKELVAELHARLVAMVRDSQDHFNLNPH